MTNDNDPMAGIRNEATSPAREVLEHLYQAFLKIPEFALRDGTVAKLVPYYPPEITEGGDLKCGVDVLLDNGTHLEFTVTNTGWGKSFIAAQSQPPRKGRGR